MVLKIPLRRILELNKIGYICSVEWARRFQNPKSMMNKSGTLQISKCVLLHLGMKCSLRGSYADESAAGSAILGDDVSIRRWGHSGRSVWHEMVLVLHPCSSGFCPLWSKGPLLSAPWCCVWRWVQNYTSKNTEKKNPPFIVLQQGNIWLAHVPKLPPLNKIFLKYHTAKMTPW